MARWLVVGETAGGELTRLSTEAATLARRLAEAGGGSVRGVVIAPSAADPAATLAEFTGSEVTAIDVGDLDAHAASARIAAEVAAFADDGEHVLLPATPDGRDTAGLLSALLPAPVLANATGVAWEGDRAVVEMQVFGGRLITRSAFTNGAGIITLRPNAVEAEAAPSPGAVRTGGASAADRLPGVKVLDRVAEAGAEASLEEARIVVVGGRGVGGEEGFRIVEELAGVLGGVVGASRAAVDAGWIPYARQVGQTGKIVKPALYLGLGVSGAMQHRVGMQSAETIVAINRDPDAPIAELADMLVIGDLFEVGPALAAELRSRRNG
jgi:electron transfer flavoprotein alpha subunit